MTMLLLGKSVMFKTQKAIFNSREINNFMNVAVVVGLCAANSGLKFYYTRSIESIQIQELFW